MRTPASVVCGVSCVALLRRSVQYRGAVSHLVISPACPSPDPCASGEGSLKVSAYLNSARPCSSMHTEMNEQIASLSLSLSLSQSLSLSLPLLSPFLAHPPLAVSLPLSGLSDAMFNFNFKS